VLPVDESSKEYDNRQSTVSMLHVVNHVVAFWHSAHISTIFSTPQQLQTLQDNTTFDKGDCLFGKEGMITILRILLISVSIVRLQHETRTKIRIVGMPRTMISLVSIKSSLKLM
jgi:hypothetical protein